MLSTVGLLAPRGPLSTRRGWIVVVRFGSTAGASGRISVHSDQVPSGRLPRTSTATSDPSGMDASTCAEIRLTAESSVLAGKGSGPGVRSALCLPSLPDNDQESAVSTMVRLSGSLLAGVSDQLPGCAAWLGAAASAMVVPVASAADSAAV